LTAALAIKEWSSRKVGVWTRCELLANFTAFAERWHGMISEEKKDCCGESISIFFNKKDTHFKIK
jgi:hypothetical protein